MTFSQHPRFPLVTVIGVATAIRQEHHLGLVGRRFLRLDVLVLELTTRLHRRILRYLTRAG